MFFVKCDGGRSKAGYRGETSDCVCRAIAIAAELPYEQVYQDLNATALHERPRGARQRSHARTGVHRQSYDRYLKKLGFRWVPCMKIGTGCHVHLQEEELPMGRLVVRVSKHMVAVIDKTIYDTHDPSRDDKRCVYGYYIKETK
ncbi:MAG: hypothetical protein KGL39_00765 [Patescibacteria group bacterium]|nr:hypothetical protein [Patescibacteria group bacterium]